jgi:hypothetical protein
MKAHRYFLFATIALSALAGHGQRGESRIKNSQKLGQILADDIADDRVVVAYHVEERINWNIGTHITTYDVDDINDVSKVDLGPDNTRIVTPKFGKARPKSVELMPMQSAGTSLAQIPKAAFEVIVPSKAAAPAAAVPAEKKNIIGYINYIDTYERILKKGYKSPDMLRKVADARYFEGNLEAAARWYKVLYPLVEQFDDAFYFRYAKSLEAVGEFGKSKEMMAIFEARLAAGKSK